MSGINKVILVGYMGKDPEIKHTRDGKEFSTFSMATSKRMREGEDKTTWHSVVIWNEVAAKYINEFAQKGTMVYIEGEIDNRQYTKPDGSTGYASDVVVSQWNGIAQILKGGVPREGEGEEREERKPAARRTGRRSEEKKDHLTESRGEADERAAWERDLDDEIPF